MQGHTRFYGSEGAVFEVDFTASSSNDRKKIAVKLLYQYDAHHLQTFQIQESVEHEIEISNLIHDRCSSPLSPCCRHIVRIYGFKVIDYNLSLLKHVGWDADPSFVHSKMATIFMELHPESLQQRVHSKGPFNEKQALLILLQIAKGIQYLLSKMVFLLSPFPFFLLPFLFSIFLIISFFFINRLFIET